MKQKHDATAKIEFGASPLVRRFAKTIADASAGKPVLDVACGSGRNALVLAKLGCAVICVDRDLSSFQAHISNLRRTGFKRESSKLSPYQLDLIKDRWPFETGVAGGIINVHFFLPELFPCFESSLSPGGYMLIETVPGCGGNYLELPKAGAMRALLSRNFELEWYKERRVGPRTYNAVTAQLVAKKRK